MARSHPIEPTAAAAHRGEITALLEGWAQHDPDASEELLARVYGELCHLAHHHLARERAGHTLQTSALVHEAYLRLLEQRDLDWASRRQFFALASRMMRRVLVNYARDRRTAKRGGGSPHLPLDETAIPVSRLPELIALDEALHALEADHPELAEVVELRYFGGLTQEALAELLGMSVPTVGRRWRTARAWLYRHLAAGEAGGRRR